MDIEELESKSISIDAALLYKNEEHLQKKSADWLIQHINHDMSDELIKEIMALVNFDSYYMLMLARFKALQVLSLKNKAICIESMMLSSILTPLIPEISGLRDFIYERIGRDKIDQMEDLGDYDFDDLSLQRQLKIKLPCVMQLYSEIIASTSGVEAAKELRSRCAIWRESMRKFWPAFGSSQVMADFSKSLDEWSKSLDEWSKSAPAFEGKQVTATLRLSQIIGIKLLKAGNDHFDEILHRVSFYRLSLDSVIDKPDKYDACIAQLGFQHVREVNKKIFDLPAEYHDFNKMRTPELCTTVISLMTGMLQLQAPALGMPFVKQYCEEKQPHIYMICVRPRISIHPEITQNGANWQLTFIINKSGRYEYQTHVINVPEGVRFGEPVYPYYEIPVIDHSGQKSQSVSLLLQRLCEQVIPCEQIPEFMYSHEKVQFDPDSFNFIRATDLEVVYVGQAFGSEGNRTAYDRLKNHETLFEVYSDIIHKNPALEPWIIIIPFEKQQIFHLLSPIDYGFDLGFDEMIRRARQGQGLDLRTRVSYTEAALIHYFKPEYNEKFKDKFPHHSHQYYRHLYSMPIEQAAVEIQTNDSLKCRLFSKVVKPKYQHLYSQTFNQYIDRKNFFLDLFDDGC